MSDPINVDESLVQRLPLPLAKLVRRAQNAKTPLDRHQAAYYLWEASLKLLGSVAIIEYADLGDHDPKLVEMLQNLARPTVGHWWEFVRRLVPPLADSGDEGFARVRELIFGRSRDDLPRVAGLDAAIVAHLQQAKASARATVQLTELFHHLVEYRNKEAAGHGAIGMRPQGSFYDRMARSLFGGMTQLLDKLDVLAGRRLIYIGDVRRQSAGDWLVERYELIGESARRIESLQVPEGDETALPRPERVYIERLVTAPQAASGRMLCLSPLIHFQPELEQVFFLNSRRGKRQAEYLCYHDGDQLRRDVATDQRELLASVLRMGVDADDFEAWVARSRAEEPVQEIATDPVPAERTIGEFELLSRLGQGGMGVVYRAWQPSLGRQVALKCMLKSGDPKAEARFAREIRALGRVEHPGVVKVFTSGSEADHWFYAMELVEGADLARVCEHLSGRNATDVDDTTWREAITSACAAARSSEVPLSDSEHAHRGLARARAATQESGDEAPETVATAARGLGYVVEVVEVTRRVAESADALHEAGIVHRDIKPGNIVVGRDGKEPVLMDLGLAQLADEAEGRLTRTRQFIGTLRYASPEQVLAATRVDSRSDIYALGATLWELLTLRPLFGATDETPTPELMQTILATEPSSPRRFNPSVPRDLEAIVLKCLEKDKARRYATAGELAADLGRFLRNEPVTARLSSPWELTVKWMRRRPAIAALSAGVLVVGLVGTGAAAWHWRAAVTSAKEAIIARNEADKQRKEAKEQAKSALIARDEAKRQRDAARVNAYVAHMNLAQREWEDAHAARVLELMEGERPKPGEADLRGFEWFYLDRLCHSGLRTLNANAGRVLSVAFSRDGRRVAAGNSDGTVTVWNAGSGQKTLALSRQNSRVAAVAFHADGRRLACVSEDGAVKMWDSGSGQTVLTLELRYSRSIGPMRPSLAPVVFSPDGRRIAAGSGYDSGLIKVWDTDSGQEKLSLVGPTRVSSVAFSFDGRRVSSAGCRLDARVVGGGPVVDLPWFLGGMIRIWDASSGKDLLTIERGKNYDNDVVFSPDGRRIASAGWDGTIRLWDAGSGRELRTFEGHTGPVYGVAFSPDGHRVASGGADKTVRVWDADSPHEPLTLQGHTSDVIRVAFSPDGRRIASASDDDTIKLWDSGSEPVLRTLRGHTGTVTSAAFSPDGSRVVSSGWDRTVRVWDVAPGRAPLTFKGHSQAVMDAAFSPDGGRIISGGVDGTVKIWDGSSGQVALTFDEHTAPVKCLAISPDGRRIASAGWDHSIKVWDAASARTEVTLKGHTNDVLGVAFSPDGERIASAALDQTAKVWDVRSGIEMLTFKGHSDAVASVAFSPGGRLVASAGADQTVQVWDVGSGRLSYPLHGHTGPVWSVAFSPDGSRIASASHDKTVKLWDTGSGQETLTLRGHTDGVIKVAFSPDGRRIASASRDGTIRIWDARGR
jgi:WD40 repeat protein/serine/threonine protein kinase